MTEEFKPISESEIICLIEEQGFDVTDTYGEASEHLAKAICQRFGQPAVPSVNELEDVINDCMDNTPESEDWLSDLQTKIAKAIHALMKGEK